MKGYSHKPDRQIIHQWSQPGGTFAGRLSVRYQGSLYPPGSGATGDVILSRKPTSWDDFFATLKGIDVPVEFLDKKERNQGNQDPFEDWRE